MRAVTAGIAVARLIVSDDRIQPVANVKRSIGTDTRFHRTELISSGHEIAHFLARKTRPCIAQTVELNLTCVVGAFQQNPAQIGGQMAASEKLRLHALAPRLRHRRG